MEIRLCSDLLFFSGAAAAFAQQDVERKEEGYHGGYPALKHGVVSSFEFLLRVSDTQRYIFSCRSRQN